jgi:hypothetical protein
MGRALIFLAESGDGFTEFLEAGPPADFAEVDPALTEATPGLGALCDDAEDLRAAEGRALNMGRTRACDPAGNGFAGAGFTLTLAEPA